MDSTFPMAVALVLLVVAVSAPIILYILSAKERGGARQDIRDELARHAEDLRAQITEVNTKMAEEIKAEVVRLGEKTNLFYEILEPQIGSLIKAPTHHKLDRSIDAWRNRTATKEELKELLEHLAKRLEEPGLMPVQAAAITLLSRQVEDFISGKYKGGAPVEGGEQRSAEDIKKHQHQMETEQVAAGERTARATPKK